MKITLKKQYLLFKACELKNKYIQKIGFSIYYSSFNLNNIYLENNQNIQYIKHSKYRQYSETSNYSSFIIANEYKG